MEELLRFPDGDALEIAGKAVVVDLFDGLLSESPFSGAVAQHIVTEDAWHGLVEIEGALVLYTEPCAGPGHYHASTPEEGVGFEISGRFLAVISLDDMDRFPGADLDGSAIIDVDGVAKSDWYGNIVGDLFIPTEVDAAQPEEVPEDEIDGAEW